MNVWFGVSASSIERPNHSWWCVSKTAAINDLLLIYAKGQGIVRVELIKSAPEMRERRCAETRLLTVDTALVKKLKTPISARQLRTDAVLHRLPAVRRNFQGTCFRVPPELWPKLKLLIGL